MPDTDRVLVAKHLITSRPAPDTKRPTPRRPEHGVITRSCKHMLCDQKIADMPVLRQLNSREPCRNNSIKFKTCILFFQTCILFFSNLLNLYIFHSIPRISLLSYIFCFACLSFIICIACVFSVSILYAYVFFASQFYKKYNIGIHKIHIKTF